MFLLNVEFGNACRFRVFQCNFSTVSRFPFLHFHAVAPVLTRVISLPGVCRLLSRSRSRSRTEHWKLPAFLPNIQNVDKFLVLTTYSYAFISLLYKQLYITVHAVEIFHCTIRFINQIEVLCETFSISFHFHKIFHENTLL